LIALSTGPRGYTVERTEFTGVGPVTFITVDRGGRASEFVRRARPL